MVSGKVFFRCYLPPNCFGGHFSSGQVVHLFLTCFRIIHYELNGTMNFTKFQFWYRFLIKNSGHRQRLILKKITKKIVCFRFNECTLRKLTNFWRYERKNQFYRLKKVKKSLCNYLLYRQWHRQPKWQKWRTSFFFFVVVVLCSSRF